MSIGFSPESVDGPVYQMSRSHPPKRLFFSPSLTHRLVISSVVMQYSMIKSSVSATMMPLQSYVSSMIFLKLLLLFSCVISCFVSCLMLIILIEPCNKGLCLISGCPSVFFFKRKVLGCLCSFVGFHVLAFVSFLSVLMF